MKIIKSSKHYLLEKLINSVFFDKLFRKIYYSKIKNRKKISLTDIRNLSKPIHPLWIMTQELHYPNMSYSHAAILKKYCGIGSNYRIKTVIEHGIYFNSDFVENIDIESDLPMIITFSQYRKKALEKKTDKKIVAVGPYVHYANHYLSTRELASEKKRLGKCLLAFPNHSTLLVKVHYDAEKYARVLKRLGKKFDTVRVCLYWKDINLGADQIYKKYGFECVSAGHMFDPLFLPRLKSIIETSTITTSNVVGTHIGYSLYLNKPHYLYKQSFKVIGDPEQIANNDITLLNEDVYQLERVLAKFSGKITKDQKELIGYYWGFDQIKSPSEMKNIFDRAEKIYKKTKKI